MAQVTGMTAGKIAELTNEAVVSGTIDTETGVLTLQTLGGEVINAGSSVDLAVSQAADFTRTEVDATSFTAGLSTERPAHREGAAFYETDTDKVIVSDGSAWHTIWQRTSQAVRAKMRATSNQSIPDATFTPVQFHSVDYDTGGVAAINPTNHFLVPAAGVYHVDFLASFGGSTATGRRVGRVMVNNVEQFRSEVGGSLFTLFTLSSDLSLNANDKVTFDLYHSAGTPIDTYSGQRPVASIHKLPD